MCGPSTTAPDCAGLRAENAALRQQVATLEAQCARYHETLAALQRATCTQTAPGAPVRQPDQSAGRTGEHQPDQAQALARAADARQMEETYASLVNHSLQAMVIYQDEQPVFANQAAATITGYSRAELFATTLDDRLRMIHPADRAQVAHAIRDRLEGKPVPARYEFRIIRKDGEVRWLEGLVTMIHYRDRPAIQSAYLDVTERKQAEAALRQSEERFRLLAENAADLIARYRIVPPRGYEYVSPAVLPMLGYTPDECYADPQIFEKIATPASRPLVERLREDPTSNSARLVVQIVRKDGRTAWIERHGWTVFDEAGRPVAIEGITRDITAQKELEAELQRAHAELEARVAERTAALVQTNQALQAEIAERRRAEAALQASQALFETFLDQSPMLIFARDLQGRYLFASRSYETITYCPRAAFIGKTPYDVMPLRNAHEFIDQDQWTVAVGTLTEREHELLLHDGPASFLVHKFPLSDAEGQVYGVGSVATNISARKQAEAALRQSEERYRTVVETSPSAILLTDLNNTISFCNQRAVELFGYTSKADICGRPGVHLLCTGHELDFLSQAQRLVQAQNIRQVEVLLHHNDGYDFPAEVSSSVVTDGVGQPTGLVIVVVDISERKQAEQALTAAYDGLAELNARLASSRNLLQALFDGLEDGLLLLDGTGLVQASNRAMAALLGSTPQQMHGQPWAELAPRIAPGFPGYLTTHTSAQRRNQQSNVRATHADGTTRMLNLQTIALRDANERIEQVIVHVADVTEYAQLQARLIENERFAVGGRLAASVAHEINTPLQALKNSLYLASIAPAEERATFLTFARDEIRRIGTITNQLLNLYRPGAAIPGPVEINLLLERILLLVGKRIGDQKVRIERNLATDLPPVQGRSDELMQVVLNLLVNALDAMPNGGTLTLTTMRYAPARPDPPATVAPTEAAPAADRVSTASTLALIVTDTGCGMSPELQPRIFEPFVTTKPHGTGVGLAISRQIVQQHGGYILVDSLLGVGSTFTVVLPAA